MAGILNAIKNLDIGSMGGKATTAITGAAAGQVQQMKDSLTTELTGVANQAKQYAYATLAFQAIAAVSAMVIAYIQFQAYTDSHRRRKANNPRRKGKR